MIPLSMLAVDLLAAATREDAAAVEAASRWLNGVDFENLPAEQYPLLPLAAGILTQAAPDDPRTARIQGIYRRTWYANQLAVRAAEQTIQAMAAAEVPVLLADGLALLQTTYGKRQRPVAGITLIVPLQCAAEAGQALVAGGWITAVTGTRGACGSLQWENHRRFRSAEQQTLDLCWHVAPYWPAPAVDGKTWERAQGASLRGAAVNVLCSADQFVRSCRAANLASAAALISLADAAALLVRGNLDWEIVLTSAEICHVGHNVLAVCETLAQVCGVTAPPTVIEKLRRLPPTPFGERQATLLTSSQPLPGWNTRLATLVANYRRQAAARGKKARPDQFVAFVPYRASGR